MTNSYRMGDWTAVVASGGAALLAPEVTPERVTTLWRAIEQGLPLSAWLESIAAGSLSALPDFALVQFAEAHTRVLVRGQVSVDVDDVTIRAEQMSTWREHVGPVVRRVVVSVDSEHTQEWPLVAGVVRASALVVELAAEPEVDGAAGIGRVEVTGEETGGDGPDGDVPDGQEQEGGQADDGEDSPHATGSEPQVGTASVLAPLSVEDAQEAPVVGESEPAGDIGDVGGEAPEGDHEGDAGQVAEHGVESGVEHGDEEPEARQEDSDQAEPEPAPEPEGEHEPDSEHGDQNVEAAGDSELVAQEAEPGAGHPESEFESASEPEAEPEPEEVPEPEAQHEPQDEPELDPEVEPDAEREHEPPDEHEPEHEPGDPDTGPPGADRRLIDSLPWNDPTLAARRQNDEDAWDSQPVDVPVFEAAGEPQGAPGQEAAALDHESDAADTGAPGIEPDLEEDEGDHDGHTVLVAHLREAREAEVPDDDTIVPGDRGGQPAPLKVLLELSHGPTVELDRPALIGRAPESARFEGPVGPHLITVPSPQQDISRSHVEIRPEGGYAIVTDLRSTNGTVVHLPQSDPRRLHPGESIPVGSGAVVDLGDGQTIAVTIHGADGGSHRPAPSTGEPHHGFGQPVSHGPGPSGAA